MNEDLNKWIIFYASVIENLVLTGEKILDELLNNKDVNKTNVFSGYVYLKNLIEIFDSISINVSEGITGVSTKGLILGIFITRYTNNTVFFYTVTK